MQNYVFHQNFQNLRIFTCKVFSQSAVDLLIPFLDVWKRLVQLLNFIIRNLVRSRRNIFLSEYAISRWLFKIILKITSIVLEGNMFFWVCSFGKRFAVLRLGKVVINLLIISIELRIFVGWLHLAHRIIQVVCCLSVLSPSVLCNIFSWVQIRFIFVLNLNLRRFLLQFFGLFVNE